MVVRRGKHAKRLQRTKRATLALASPAFVKCPQCGADSLPHRVCANCGAYSGREVINVLAKLEKKERKKKERELESARESQGQGKPLSPQAMSRKETKKEKISDKSPDKEKEYGHAHLNPGDHTGPRPEDRP